MTMIERDMLRRLQVAYYAVDRQKWLKPKNSVSNAAMTEERLIALLKARLGDGRNEHYRPWISVTRPVSSPFSHVNILAVPIHRRPLHLL